MPRLPNGNSGVSLTVDGIPLTGEASVQLQPTAPSPLTIIVSSPRPDGFSVPQTNVADIFTALHALASTT